jgi:hypothetical protein
MASIQHVKRYCNSHPAKDLPASGTEILKYVSELLQSSTDPGQITSNCLFQYYESRVLVKSNQNDFIAYTEAKFKIIGSPDFRHRSMCLESHMTYLDG